MRIDACFDSHVHWAATGEFAQRLQLGALKSANEIQQLKPEAHHFQGEWLLGFGWDDNTWPEKPSRGVLDKWFPDKPVALTRADGHALWVNTEALKRSKLLEGERPVLAGGRIELLPDGSPSGILIDQASELVEAFIPQATGFEIRRNMLRAMKMFNAQGFTHIRDMTCDEFQWHEALKLEQSGVLTMAVEEYFWLKSPSNLTAVLKLMKEARAAQTGNLRAMGAKIFLDGALGSEGAWLSKCYHGRSHAGLKLWEESALREALAKIWEAGFHVAVHAIGDEASDWIVNIAGDLHTGGVKGALHIEHGELIRPETIQKMKSLAIECHLQPTHWLSDQKWLKEKIGPLMDFAFPWRRLQEAEVTFDFGSDSPIEPPSVKRTFEALRSASEAGIPRLLGMPSSYMGHRDLSWAPNSYSTFENEEPVHVVFRGEHLT